MFTFDELIGRSTGPADYLELVRSYEAFVVTGVPAMTYRERDLARRFITFVDAVYESRVRLIQPPLPPSPKQSSPLASPIPSFFLFGMQSVPDP